MNRPRLTSSISFLSFLFHRIVRKPSFLLSLCIPFILVDFAQAQFKSSAALDDFKGMYRGHYECENQTHPLLIHIARRGRITVYGLYNQTIPLNFLAKFRIKRGRRHFDLIPQKWINRPSEDFAMMRLSGSLRKNRLRGEVQVEGCGYWEATRIYCQRGIKTCDPQDLGRFDQYRHIFRKRSRSNAFRRSRTVQQDRFDSSISPQPSGPMAMEGSEFSRFKAQIEDASFHNKRVPIVTLAVQSNYFTSAQVLEILKIWSFDNKRFQILKLFKPRIIDPKNSYIILDVFTFDRHRKQAVKLFAQ